jgi:hypothetical protein
MRDRVNRRRRAGAFQTKATPSFFFIVFVFFIVLVLVLFIFLIIVLVLVPLSPPGDAAEGERER